MADFLFKGDWQGGIPAEALHITDGRIDEIGSNADALGRGGDVLDLAGMSVTPGFIDSHVHPQIGDWSSRHRMIDWIEGYGRAGATMVSQDSPHLQGRPRDALGTRLLAMPSARVFANDGPGGVRVAGGAVLLEPGLVHAHCPAMYVAGVRHVGEIGISGIQDPAGQADGPSRACRLDAQQHAFRGTEWGGVARDGHRRAACAPTRRPGPRQWRLDGASRRRADRRRVDDPSLPGGQLRRRHKSVPSSRPNVGGARRGSSADPRVRHAQRVRDRAAGDPPPGRLLCGLAGWAPGDAIAAASGNAQRAFGLEAGAVELGAPADLLCPDAPLESTAVDPAEALAFGDMPGIAAVVQDGVVMSGRAVNSPFPQRAVVARLTSGRRQ